ncbi:hypothetical protein [Geofilum rubicundum]|uniref:Uncharacterized protein n=1 Tax=Geofilum rubicundum JCM 15548 TaxID=1236989 RepID=A0A0E9LR91_9BACT|nr:hypothetical protein [Geofilum rubicundum]GAO28097.1 hypothetical protein JCM15548_158 [Geofilum rubicundum JCM 15548]
MNNKKTAGKYIKTFAISWLTALALFVLSVVVKNDLPVAAQIALGVLVVLIAVFFASGGYHYIEIESEKDLFRIKYFNLFPMGREYKSIQIPWSRYRKHEIKPSFNGLFHHLYIYEQTRGGLARYPAIGFSALNAAEREKILTFLKKMEK